MIKLSKAHLNKIKKDPKKQAAGVALENRVNAIMALFEGHGDLAPEFPGQLTLREQGRFALGFHQQKAGDHRDRQAAIKARQVGQPVDETEARRSPTPTTKIDTLPPVRSRPSWSHFASIPTPEVLRMNAPLTNRHDILILFEVTNGNPNGDPDSGNMPRVDPSSSLGLVSDVCLKRKVRNFVEQFPPAANGKAFDIFIRQGAVLETQQKEAEAATDDKKRTKDVNAKDAKNWLCRKYYDIRTFGAVVSTGKGVLAGSAHGQVRGPVQFTFGRSLHPINPVEVTITRCAVTREEDAAKERTMGQKYIVPYGVYAAKCYVSPAFAEQTGFDQGDYDLLIEALTHLFDHDRSASRGDMVCPWAV